MALWLERSDKLASTCDFGGVVTWQRSGWGLGRACYDLPELCMWFGRIEYLPGGL